MKYIPWKTFPVKLNFNKLLNLCISCVSTDRQQEQEGDVQGLCKQEVMIH